MIWTVIHTHNSLLALRGGMGYVEEDNDAILHAKVMCRVLPHWDLFEGVTPLRDVMNQFLDESFLRSLCFGFVGRVFPFDIFETEYEIDALSCL